MEEKEVEDVFYIAASFEIVGRIRDRALKSWREHETCQTLTNSIVYFLVIAKDQLLSIISHASAFSTFYNTNEIGPNHSPSAPLRPRL